MKRANLPPIRIDEYLRAAAESVLQEGETLSSFILESVIRNIERRETRQDFIARGLQAAVEAKNAGEYISAEEALLRLDQILTRYADGSKDH